MGEAATGVVGEEFVGNASEHLGFTGKAAEGAGMQDARGIASERAAVRVRVLGISAPGEGAGIGERNSDSGWQWSGRGELRCGSVFWRHSIWLYYFSALKMKRLRSNFQFRRSKKAAARKMNREGGSENLAVKEKRRHA